MAPHCTAVPRVAEGSCLLSLFCFLPGNVVNVLGPAAAVREKLGERAQPKEKGKKGGGGPSSPSWQMACVCRTALTRFLTRRRAVSAPRHGRRAGPRRIHGT